MAIGHHRDNSGLAQQIVVPCPAHLRDETDNVATIQNSDKRRVAVGRNGSLFDRRAKMSTSRKLRGKLAKHRRSARKATSTEAARKEPEPEPTERSTAERPATTQRGTVTACSGSQVLNLFAFATGCRAKNYLQD